MLHMTPRRDCMHTRKLLLSSMITWIADSTWLYRSKTMYSSEALGLHRDINWFLCEGVVHYTNPRTACTTGISRVSSNRILSRPCFDYPCYRLTDHRSGTNSASCIHIYPLPSVWYVLHITCEIPPIMLMNFTAYIIFPRFLSLHQLFGSLLPRRVYHRHCNCLVQATLRKA